MNRRKLLTLLSFGVLAGALPALAQQKGKAWRIGFLGSASPSGAPADRMEALRAGLRDLGYVEGKNIVIEYRWAEENYGRLPQLAAELVHLKVDVIVTHGTPGTRAAKTATTTIPIVVATSGDLVALGLVASLARPGGNVTGSTIFTPEITAKRLELLADVLPRMRRAAALINSDNPAKEPVLQALEATAKSRRLELQPFGVRGQDEFASVFLAMAKSRVDAVVLTDDPMLNANFAGIANAAARQRLPSAGPRESAEAGGLIGYGINLVEMWRRAAFFVDKILKGAKPGDLPIERATTFDLVINMKTAKALGITIPQSILVRADRVIE